MVFVTLVVVGVLVITWWSVHRSSFLVRRWHPSSFPRRAAGSLSVLDSGPTGRPGEQVLVVLHGLGATGDYFGAFYDGLSRSRRVLIVDLLGFGHSLDEERCSFGVDDHVAALEGALVELGLDSSDVVLAAHSMSSAIALTWADRHRDRAKRVVLWGPPIYRDEDAARAVGKAYGLMGRLFLLDSTWAERACRVSCQNRDASGRLMAVMAPRWPIELSRDASLHTWEAYHQSLRALVLDFDWSEVLPAPCPVTIFRGADDPIGDEEYIAALFEGAEIVAVPDTDHHVALEHPELLFATLERT